MGATCSSVRRALVALMLLMLLCAAEAQYGANVGNRALNQRQGVPCEELQGSNPGGVTAVRRGNRCFVNSPASGGLVRFGLAFTPNPNQSHPPALDEL